MGSLPMLGAGPSAAAGLYDAYAVYDTFTDTNGTGLDAHTPDKDAEGGGWTEASGQFEIQSNEVNIDVVANEKTVWIDAGVANCTVELKVRCGSSFCPGLLFRYTNNNAYWMLQLHKALQQLIIKEDAAGYVSRASKVYTVTENVEYELKVVLSGTSITAYVNGSEELSFVSAANQTAKKHGIWGNSPGAGPGESDNFKVS